MIPSAIPAPERANPSPAPAHALSAEFLSALQRLTRSGVQTTEFWSVLFLVALFTLEMWGGRLSPDVAGLLSTVLVVAYKFFRVEAKATAGDQIVNLADAVASDPGSLLRRVAVLPPIPTVPVAKQVTGEGN